jgi:hypothetical protein
MHISNLVYELEGITKRGGFRTNCFVEVELNDGNHDIDQIFYKARDYIIENEVESIIKNDDDDVVCIEMEKVSPFDNEKSKKMEKTFDNSDDLEQKRIIEDSKGFTVNNIKINNYEKLDQSQLQKLVTKFDKLDKFYEFETYKDALDFKF